jgi:hypothetical protein
MRRLEEAYCVQYAGCFVASMPQLTEDLTEIVAGSQFATCLDEEAAERATHK